MEDNKSKLPLSIKILIALVVCGAVLGIATCSTPAKARDVSVNGYVRSDGVYVPPHHRSAPDSNQFNNYGTQGNYNPYTGQQGTQPIQPQQPIYGNPYGNSRGNSSIGPYGR